jgi:hypothetical protein
LALGTPEAGGRAEALVVFGIEAMCQKLPYSDDLFDLCQGTAMFSKQKGF